VTSETPLPSVPPPRPPASSNALGVAGFIVSLVGLVLTCGLLCPVGLGLSIFGLRKEPRGLAIAGTAIGAIGTMLAITVAIVAAKGFELFGKAMEDGRFAMEGPRVGTEVTLSMAEELIDLDNAEHSRLPTDEAGTALLATLTDGWGHALRYERGTEDGYTIRSAGPDGAFGTTDDVTATR
jgi:hypothetical protein